MPSLYGRGPYGQGNYSAATTYQTSWATGAFAVTANAIAVPVVIRTPVIADSFAITGSAIGTGIKVKTPVNVGSIAVIGSGIGFSFSTVWSPETRGADPWVPDGETSTIWTPVIPGTSPWSGL